MRTFAALGFSAGLLFGGAIPAAAQVVYRLPISGTIENGLAPYVARGLAEAEAAGATLVVLEIDTPGGRVDAAQKISDALRASRVRTVAWVAPRAYSAGAMIALSATEIWMKDGAVLGAATPVDGSGTKAPEKYVSAMRAEFRAIAEQRGYNVRIAEAMVDESVGAPGIADSGQLVTLTTQQAIAAGFAKGIANDPTSLLASVGAAGSSYFTPEITWAELVVRFLTDPIIAPLLLSLGILGIVFEIKAGAFGIGALVSMTSIGLFFGSHLLLGLAGWEEVLLLGLGLILLLVEVFILPGFGIAGILGLAAISGAAIMAMLGILPTGSDILQAVVVLGAALFISVALLFAWLRHLPNSQRASGLLLKEGIGAKEGYVSGANRDDLIGRDATALTDLRPAGTATVDGERIDVVTEGEFIKAGTPVRVVRSEGYRHIVRAS
jgi:membrane-bound serine protease (ClpP class)